MWRTLFQFPRRALGFLSRGEGALASLSKQVARLGDLLRDSRKRGDASRDELRKVRQELADLRREVHDRLLQNTMTVTRAARALEGGAGGHAANGNGDVRLSSRPIAVEPGRGPGAVVGARPRVPRRPDPEGREWLTLAACPACGHPHFTVVSPWNKLILLEKAPGRHLGALRLRRLPRVRDAVCVAPALGRTLSVPAAALRGGDGQARRGSHHQPRPQPTPAQRRRPGAVASSGRARACSSRITPACRGASTWRRSCATASRTACTPT